MPNSNINPVSLSASIAAGAAGGAIATNAKPIAQKAFNISEPIVDTVAVSAKKAVATAENGVSKFAIYMNNFIDLLGKTITEGFKALKAFLSDLAEKIDLPKTTENITNKFRNSTEKLSDTVSQTFANTSKRINKYHAASAIAVGITSAALYSGYKLVSSQKEDK